MQHWDNPLLVHRLSGTDYADTDKNGEASKPVEKKPLVWDWALEHEDRKKEAKSDEARHGAGPFQVDRKLLKDIVREKMEAEVVRIQFLGAGEFTSEIYLWLNSLTLCFGASKAPSTRQVALLLDSRLTLFLPFLQGYLITLADGREVVARVARRFMPRLKTESEVATMRYLRERTTIPVPTVFHYDANPFNRLGGEYILMSKVCCVSTWSGGRYE